MQKYIHGFTYSITIFNRKHHILHMDKSTKVNSGEEMTLFTKNIHFFFSITKHFLFSILDILQTFYIGDQNHWKVAAICLRQMQRSSCVRLFYLIFNPTHNLCYNISTLLCAIRYVLLKFIMRNANASVIMNWVRVWMIKCKQRHKERHVIKA